MSVKGWLNKAKLASVDSFFATLNPVRLQQIGLDVLSHASFQLINTDTAETGSTTLIIQATTHNAKVGDFISFTTGSLATLEFKVWKTSTNLIYVGEEMPATPSNGDTFSILRHKAQVVGSDGSTPITFAATATGSNQKKGKLAGSALTGSYQTLLALTFDTKILFFFNSCDQGINISLDGGTTTAFELEAGESFDIDLAQASLKVSSGVNISAKHDGVAPVNGSIRCSAIG